MERPVIESKVKAFAEQTQTQTQSQPCKRAYFATARGHTLLLAVET